MRDYGKVGPRFWTGETGRQLRGNPEAQIVAAYLMTSPHATMIGVYTLPMLYLAHETGLGLKGAQKGLRRCIEVGFCTYDAPSEWVFVHTMAEHQIGIGLDPKDKRLFGIRKQYSQLPAGPVRAAFAKVYGDEYGLPNDPEKPRGMEAPSEPLRSQEQEQEQEHKDPPPDGGESKPPSGVRPDPCPHAEIVAAYHAKLPMLRRVRDWTADRQALLRGRWRESRTHQSLAWWEGFFEYIAKSDFLTGRTQGHDRRPFDCDLEWIVRPRNFRKIVEGKYENAAA